MMFGTAMKKQIAYTPIFDLSFDMMQDCGEKGWIGRKSLIDLTSDHPTIKLFFSLFHNRFQTDLCTCSRYVLAKDISWT